MDNLSERMKSFLIGLSIFILLVLFFYLTKIDAYFILTIYLLGFWIYISFIDLKNIRNTRVSNEDFDNPTLIELKQFCKIWKNAKYISQTLGFILLIIGFVTEKNIPFFMIVGTLCLGGSLLFNSIYMSDINKIKEIQYKERNN